MHPKILKRIRTNPKAHLDSLHGKLPKMRRPKATPLWLCLSKVSPRDRLRIIGVRLSPALGYNSSQVFGNAEQLFNWLGGSGEVGDWEVLPSETRAINSFQSVISMELLASNSSQFPSDLLS